MQETININTCITQRMECRDVRKSKSATKNRNNKLVNDKIPGESV